MWFYDVDWELTLKYVQTYLSWPVLATLVAFTFIHRFQADIRTFLANVRPKAPGFEPAYLDQPPLPPAPWTEPDDPTEAAATAADAAADMSEAEQAALIEEFRYLNKALVLSTQRLLTTLAESGPVLVEELDWQYPDLTGDQQANMVAALYQHDLIAVTGTTIRTTGKGDNYVMWPERTAWVNAQEAMLEGPRPMTRPRQRRFDYSGSPMTAQAAPSSSAPPRKSAF